MTRWMELAAGFVIAGLMSGAAFADVDVKTP